MCGLKMEGISLDEVEVLQVNWDIAEDGDTAHAYHTEPDKLVEYLRKKAEERRKELE